MWQIHWMLSLLPDTMFIWITYLLFGLGIVLYIVSKLVQWIPMITRYKLPVELAGIVLLVVGSYLLGRWDADQDWKERVKQLQAAVAEAESRSREVNTVIQTKVVTKIKVVKETVYANREIIREVAGAQLDSQCTLPRSSVVLHDSASRNEVARGAESVDGTPSDIKASALLSTVVENYGSCNENIEKLKAWQEWYRAQKQIFEGVSK
jgi:hypothetical protein